MAFELHFNVSGFTIKAREAYKVPVDNRNYVYANFTFSDEWIGLPPNAIFVKDGLALHAPIEGGKCRIPWEMFTTPGKVDVGCIAGDRAASVSASFQVVEGIYRDSWPSEPPPPTYEYMLTPSDHRILLMRMYDNSIQYFSDGTWHTVGAGLDGPPGPMGEQGPPGPQGIVGPQGAIGLTGSQGEIGPPGPQGIQGQEGPRGDVGPQGIQGTQGPKGDKGDTGAKGDKGDTGAKGDKGDTGAQGIQGATGDAGKDGAGIQLTGEVSTYAELTSKAATLTAADAGKAWFNKADGRLYIWSGASFPANGAGAEFRGPQGIQGVQGIQGIKGDTGATGAKGDKGDPGIQGIQGVKGVKGDAGATGATGAKGDPGIQGIQGVKGDKGDKGDPGTSGAKGDPGIQGIKGDKGDPGPAGGGDHAQRTQAGIIKASSPDGYGLVPIDGTIVNTNMAVSLNMMGTAAQDFNNYRTPGEWYFHINSATNGPSFVTGGIGLYLKVMGTLTTNSCTQQCWKNGTTEIYTRFLTKEAGGDWSAWYRLSMSKAPYLQYVDANPISLVLSTFTTIASDSVFQINQAYQYADEIVFYGSGTSHQVYLKNPTTIGANEVSCGRTFAQFLSYINDRMANKYWKNTAQYNDIIHTTANPSATGNGSNILIVGRRIQVTSQA